MKICDVCRGEEDIKLCSVPNNNEALLNPFETINSQRLFRNCDMCLPCRNRLIEMIQAATVSKTGLAGQRCECSHFCGWSQYLEEL